MVTAPIRTVPAQALPLSLQEIKAHLRVDITDDDPLIMGYLRAAVEWVEDYAGLSLIDQTWTQTFDAFVSPVILYRRPVQSIMAVTYLDASGIEQALGASTYVLTGAAHPFGYPYLTLVSGGSWPILYDQAGAVSVSYVAGFGPDHNSVPELIRHAVSMVTHSFYDYRSDIVSGSVAEVPHAAKALLRSYRPLAVA